MIILVAGHKWAIMVADPQTIAEGFGDKDATAFTDKSERRIYLPLDASLPMIIHELAHAHISECHLDCDVGLPYDLAEEFFCNLIGENLYEIGAQAREIYRRLKRKK